MYLSVITVFVMFVFSVLSFNSSLRSLYALFCVSFFLSFWGSSFLSYSIVLLFMMVYLSGLGVVFVYLMSVNMDLKVSLNMKLGFIGVLGFWFWGFNFKEWFLSYLPTSSSFEVSLMVLFVLSFVVLVGFVFLMYGVSNNEVCVRSELK